MSTTDHAFFAAYGQVANSNGKPSRSRKTAAATANHQHVAPSVVTQFSDGGWYRVDQKHPDSQATPAPHGAKGTNPARDSHAESVSFEFGSWSTADDWQSSSLVIATSLPTSPAGNTANRPTEKTEKHETEARPAQKAISSTPEPIKPTELVEKSTTGKQATPSPAPWTAQWEVDEFAWPDELLRLQDAQSEYFRYAGEKLRDACQEGLKTLAVVATRDKEGCTTMAICLARAAAEAGARVALVDANLHHPDLGAKLGLDFSHGWQESVKGDSSLAEAAVVALDSRLTLLPLSATHRLDSLHDPRVSTVLREISTAFDLLVIDAGVSPAGRAPLFEAGSNCPVNAVLVVRDLRRTSEAETIATASQLKALGIDAIGIAENFSPRTDSRTAAA